MHIRLLDWNINGFSLKHQDALLAERDWDVCTLQKVTRETWPLLLEALEPASGDVSFHHLPPLAGKYPRYHCAVLVKPPLEFESHGALRDVPSPERALVGTVTAGEQAVTVASFALPPGVSWGGRASAVRRNGSRRGCATVRRPCWWVSMRTRLGSIAPHSPTRSGGTIRRRSYWVQIVRTICVTSTATGSIETSLGWRRSSVSVLRPLEISHMRGRGNNRTPCRYDHVLASPEFKVHDVSYDMEGAVAAGSDHAIVEATLQLTRSGG